MESINDDDSDHIDGGTSGMDLLFEKNFDLKK